MWKTDSNSTKSCTIFLRIERKKINIYALHKRGKCSLAIYAMVNKITIVYHNLGLSVELNYALTVYNFLKI